MSENQLHNNSDDVNYSSFYKYGLIAICLGATMLLGDFFQIHIVAVFYFGVTCAVLGTILICVAFCSMIYKQIQIGWNADNDNDNDNDNNSNNNQVSSISVINVNSSRHVITNEPPPDYYSVMDLPPNYDSAIKLNKSNWDISQIKSVDVASTN